MRFAQLQQANCATPFSLLGWQPLNHNGDGGFILRVYLPHAKAISAYCVNTGKFLGDLTENQECAGLFELRLIKKRNIDAYTLLVTENGIKRTLIDPYQFTKQAFAAVHDINTKPQHLYKQLGAQLFELEHGSKTLSATRFAVYAPSASSVSLVGDMNHWDGRVNPMQRTECGHWVLVMPNVAKGARYKFEIKDANGHLLSHKADPLAFYAEQYPSHASLVYDHHAYKWQDDAWRTRTRAEPIKSAINIYELHLGSWLRDEDNHVLSYQDIAAKLIPYVLEMGYTHIEILPVMEHPFDGSWGYQPLGLFAPTSRFGEPDEFKFFIDSCHQAGIAVILDWVPAHFPDDAHGLAKFDGSALYEYADPRRGWHPDWNSCIYDYGKDYVRQFLIASALFWFDYFHIDGLRVDAVASMLYLDYSRQDGQWLPNCDGGNHNYEAISFFKTLNTQIYSQYPHAITIAEESTSFAKVSHPVELGGLGFGFKWNMGWMNDTLRYMQKEWFYRRYHHKDITFSMVYAYNENFILPLSHDEVVHGKHSLLEKMPGDEWQQAANLRTYIAFMFAHPGKKLNFMGNEFAQGREWAHTKSLEWSLLEYAKHKGFKALHKDLNQLYKTTPALYELDYELAGFTWLSFDDAQNSTLGFIRQDSQGNCIYVICNFTPTPQDNTLLGVKALGEYEIILNTDSKHYWGSDYKSEPILVAKLGPHQGMAQHICFNLPPLATVYIRQKCIK